MNHILSLHIDYCVYMYYRFHLGVLLPLNFWSTAMYAIWVRNDVALSHFCAFEQQLTACRSFHSFLVYIGRLPPHSLSSSFSSISMMYQKQFQISPWCAVHVCGKWYGWIHWWMQHDDCHSNLLVRRTDNSFYNMYDITPLKSVSTFRH
jgi:hypothetical protein